MLFLFPINWIDFLSLLHPEKYIGMNTVLLFPKSLAFFLPMATNFSFYLVTKSKGDKNDLNKQESNEMTWALGSTLNCCAIGITFSWAVSCHLWRMFFIFIWVLKAQTLTFPLNIKWLFIHWKWFKIRHWYDAKRGSEKLPYLNEKFTNENAQHLLVSTLVAGKIDAKLYSLLFQSLETKLVGLTYCCCP